MLCRIGDIEVWRILEANAPFLAPDVLFPNAGPHVGERVAHLVRGGLCPKTGKMILPIQGFLLKTPSHVILVDSCIGNHKTVPRMPAWHQRQDSRFLAGLTTAGVAPEEVDYVLCTHLHVDHIGWNTQLLDGRWVPTFANARYVMPDEDEALQRAQDQPIYAESVLPIIAAGQAELVQAPYGLGDHVMLVPTPGHTPGHVSVVLRSGAEEAVITGDALHSTAQMWHPDWHFCFDDDAEAAVVARRGLLEDSTEANRIMLGSHFLLPSIGRVRAKDDAFRWSPCC